jgi:hypothetical protein
LNISELGLSINDALRKRLLQLLDYKASITIFAYSPLTNTYFFSLKLRCGNFSNGSP